MSLHGDSDTEDPQTKVTVNSGYRDNLTVDPDLSDTESDDSGDSDDSDTSISSNYSDHSIPPELVERMARYDMHLSHICITISLYKRDLFAVTL